MGHDKIFLYVRNEEHITDKSIVVQIIVIKTTTLCSGNKNNNCSENCNNNKQLLHQ